MAPGDALRIAQEKSLDLVLVSDKADPPVCRVMDYKKFKYEQVKKISCGPRRLTPNFKEVKMRCQIEEQDYQVRLTKATDYLEAGDKVRVNIMFRGREIQHKDLRESLLMRMADDLQEVAEVEEVPEQKGRSVIMLLSRKK